MLFDLEVIDKRETGGNSTTMEREALRRLLERLVIELPLGELCTDASSTIIKLVRDMKGRLCDFSEKPVMLYYCYCCCLSFISKFFLFLTLYYLRWLNFIPDTDTRYFPHISLHVVFYYHLLRYTRTQTVLVVRKYMAYYCSYPLQESMFECLDHSIL